MQGVNMSSTVFAQLREQVMLLETFPSPEDPLRMDLMSD